MNNDGFLVNVHMSQTYYHLWYRCGRFNFSDKEVYWADSHPYGGGVMPSIAMIRTMDSINAGFLVEVHKSQNYDDLWYRVGRF